MADTAPDAGQAKSPVKTQRKKRSGKMNAFPLVKLIIDAVRELKDRRGTSMYKIKGYLSSKGVDVKSCNSRINRRVKDMVIKEDLIQVSGRGASGSFKLPAKASTKTPKPARKTKDKKRDKSTTPKRSRSKKSDQKKEGKKTGKQAAVKRAGKKTTKDVKKKKEDKKKKAPRQVNKKKTPNKTPNKRAPAKRSTGTKAKASRATGKRGGRKASK